MAFLFLLLGFLYIQSAAGSDSDLIDKCFGLVDEGEQPAYVLKLKKALLDGLDGSADNSAFSLGATFLTVSEMSWYQAGSGCPFSDIIKANVKFHNGKLSRSELRSTVNTYARISALAAENLRILGQCCILPTPWGIMDNSCGDYGRAYPFDDAWSFAPIGSSALKMTAADLYGSVNALRCNNAGGALGAANSPIGLAFFKNLKSDLSDFLKLATSDGDCGSRKKNLRTGAGKLKSAIYAAADKTVSQLSSRCH